MVWGSARESVDKDSDVLATVEKGSDELKKEGDLVCGVIDRNQAILSQ